MPTLTMPTRDYGLMKQMKAEVSALNDGIRLEYPSFDNILVAARRTVREAAFDICEMPVTTYICAKAHGKPITAIPVFLTRNFHHGAIFYDTRSDIRGPKDLEGRTVGVNRGYTVTTGVWARDILKTEYGVDLDRVHWAATDDEHVAEVKLPPNADYAFKGRKMSELYESRAIDASVGALGAVFGGGGAAPESVRPLIPDAVEAGFAYYRKTGIYPVNHTVVVRDELLQAHPGLARDLFQALKASKKAYYAALDRSAALSEEDALTLELEKGIGGDPFPYGVEPNRKAMEALARTAVDQHIASRRFTMDELFAPETLGLTE
jgi:4,5-dihydroxyphthalate decarboxylase